MPQHTLTVGITFSDKEIKRIKDLYKKGDIAAAQKIIIARLSEHFGPDWPKEKEVKNGKNA
jgi:hypothetical protein